MPRARCRSVSATVCSRRVLNGNGRPVMPSAPCARRADQLGMERTRCHGAWPPAYTLRSPIAVTRREPADARCVRTVELHGQLFPNFSAVMAQRRAPPMQRNGPHAAEAPLSSSLSFFVPVGRDAAVLHTWRPLAVFGDRQVLAHDMLASILSLLRSRSGKSIRYRRFRWQYPALRQAPWAFGYLPLYGTYYLIQSPLSFVLCWSRTSLPWRDSSRCSSLTKIGLAGPVLSPSSSAGSACSAGKRACGSCRFP